MPMTFSEEKAGLEEEIRLMVHNKNWFNRKKIDFGYIFRPLFPSLTQEDERVGRTPRRQEEVLQRMEYNIKLGNNIFTGKPDDKRMDKEGLYMYEIEWILSLLNYRDEHKAIKSLFREYLEQGPSKEKDKSFFTKKGRQRRTID